MSIFIDWRVTFGPFETVFVKAARASDAVLYASHSHPDLVALCKSRRKEIKAVPA